MTAETPCPMTNIYDCQARTCELHYMDAPLDLGPDFCPACGASLLTQPHKPYGPEWCTDIYAGLRGLAF